MDGFVKQYYQEFRDQIKKTRNKMVGIHGTWTFLSG